jgi:biopolymer transport protein ExbB
MIEIIKAGGWLMLPIILCSIIAVAITIERLWTLQPGRVLPRDLAMRVWEWARDRQLDQKHLTVLAANSPMGRILAAGPGQPPPEPRCAQGNRAGHRAPRGARAGALPEFARHHCGHHAVARPARHRDRHGQGVHRHHHRRGWAIPGVLAGGISEALITTAAGLSVAIPSLIAYRYLRGRVDALVVEMEKEAMKLVDALARHAHHGSSERHEPAARGPVKSRRST